MCRFVMYLGPRIPLADLVTRPSHSLIRQSFKAREREEPLNGDGFGLAWYAPEASARPAVFRDVTPAWNNENLAHVARVTQSSAILAHVRAATQGLAVIQTNCHPFTSGPYAFMHNGNVAGFWKLRRRFLATLSDSSFSAIRGTTDSEHVFGLFLDRLAEERESEPLAAMANALARALEQVAELVSGYVSDADDPHGATCTLNMAITDGVRAVASRCVIGDTRHANTLYLCTDGRYVYKDGESRIEDPNDHGPAVLVASEPLFERERWTGVPMNHLVLIDEQRKVTLRPWG